MIAARSASVKPLQPPISGRVRQQPRHRLEAPSTTQTLTQGLAIDRGGAAEGWEPGGFMRKNIVRLRSKNACNSQAVPLDGC